MTRRLILLWGLDVTSASHIVAVGTVQQSEATNNTSQRRWTLFAYCHKRWPMIGVDRFDEIAVDGEEPVM